MKLGKGVNELWPMQILFLFRIFPTGPYRNRDMGGERHGHQPSIVGHMMSGFSLVSIHAASQCSVER